MLVIRLFRVGKKNQPSFKIVVTDKRKPPRSGRFVEEVGFYNPLTKEKILRQERIKYWLSKGAKPSDTVYNLFVSEKIIEGKKIDVHKKAKKAAASPPSPPAEAKVETPEKPAEEKIVEEAKAAPEIAKEEVSAEKPAEEKELVKEKPAEELKTEFAEPAAKTKEKKEAKPSKVAEEKAKEEVKNE